MIEYITKEQALKIIDNVEADTSYWAITIDGYVIPKPDTFERLRMEINNLPPANVVEVVRCKDCANKMSCYISGIYRDEDNYCFRGTKLDGGENDD